MSTEIAISIGILLLVLVGYLTFLSIKQKQSLKRFKSIIDVEAEQKRIRDSINKEQKKAKKAINVCGAAHMRTCGAARVRFVNYFIIILHGSCYTSELLFKYNYF